MATTPQQPAPKPRLSAKLVDELMAHKTLALRAELASQPDLALRFTVFALAANAMSELGPLSLIRVRVDEVDVSSAHHPDGEQSAGWLRRVAQCLARTPAVGHRCAMVVHRLGGDRPPCSICLRSWWRQRSSFAPAAANTSPNLLCQAAGLDMSKWWSATPESYFEHVRKDVLIDAIKEEKPTLDRVQARQGAEGRTDRARQAHVQRQRLAARTAAHAFGS